MVIAFGLTIATMFSQSDVIGFLTCKELVKTLLVRSIGKQNKRSSRLSILHYFFVYIYYLYCTAGILDNQTATSADNPLNVEEKDMNMTVLLPQQGSNMVACGGFRKLSVSTFLFPVVSAHHSFLSKVLLGHCGFLSLMWYAWTTTGIGKQWEVSVCKGMHYWVEILYFDAQLERIHN